MARLRLRIPLALAALAAALLALPAAGSASTLLTRNPQGPIGLKVSKEGVALVTLRAEGRQHRILAWGAVDMSQGRLDLDYSGGTGRSGEDWRTLVNACGPYRGGRFPGSELIAVACTAPDGSHWAVQTWRRTVRNYGGETGTVDVRLSHWTNPVADLEVYSDWSRYGPSMTQKWPHLFGVYSWRGNPIAVGLATPQGVPLDDKGRNLYLDSLNPDYGFPAGTRTWRRVNAFLANRPHGQFCFEVGPKRDAPTELGRTKAGISTANRYRLTTPGPGVTPDIRIVFDGPPSPYDPYWQLEMNEIQRQLVGDPNANCGSPKLPTFPRGVAGAPAGP